MITSEQVVEYLIMIDLQRKGAENKLNAEGLSTLLDLQSDKELKDVKIVDILDYIHTQEEEIEDYKKALNGEMFINFKLPMEHAQFKRQLVEKDKEIKKLNLMIKTLPNHDAEMEKEIRKQVCDEIRNAVNCLTSFECDFGCDVVFKKRFDKFLDQIEKGNSNE